ncbi:MAG: AMP-binding protein [Acidobacteriota bacterium]
MPNSSSPPTPSDVSPADRLDIGAVLCGERLFITGATGFLGKVLVERLLWSVPDVGRLLLLIRPGRDRSAADRLRDEILASPLLARLRAFHGDGWGAWAAGKIEAIAGDLEQDRFGLDEDAYRKLCGRVDRVVASAATVTFDERLDRALELNARGALRTLALARDAGDAPLVHVSTCYVSGQRRGEIPESPLTADDDPEATLARLDEACSAVTSRSPTADEEWIEAGAQLAEEHGFHDIYTFTKALGEQLLNCRRGTVPLAILRPAIVESAAAQPIPGWIDAVRVTDPIVVAYGRGRNRDIPGSADAALELVPVDYVVHALIAALAALPRSASADSAIPVYQVSSSRHPITLGELMVHAREGFSKAPLRDEDGEPIAPQPARFVEPVRFHGALVARRERVRRESRQASKARQPRLRAEARTLDHFLRLVEVYRPYLSHGGTYDDAATQSLWRRLSPAERQIFPFDIAALDWRAYIADSHIPGLVRFALKADTGAPPPQPPAPLRSHAEKNAATVYELFERVAQADGAPMAFQTFRDGRWLRYSYGQGLITASNIAHRLHTEYGVERGDRIVLWATGSPEWVLTLFAAHRLGAVVVPLDPQWPAEEVRRAADLVGAKLICAAPRLASTLGAGTSQRVVVLAAPFVPEPDVDLLPTAGAVPNPPGSSEDLAIIVFTSGTTVSPKAVPLTHGNLLANVRDLGPLMKLSRERLLSVLPIHHVFELMIGLLVPLAGGSTVSYVAEVKPAEISWMMATTRPTVLVAVPRLLQLLHNGIMASVAAGGLERLFKVLFALSKASGGRLGHRLFGKVHQRFGGCLRRIATGGSALEPSLGRSFALMGFQVAEGYGMTETSPALAVNPWDGIRFGAAGRALPGVEIDLRPPAEGQAQGVEEGSGEIWVRGDNVMAGYYRNPAATEEVMADGWLNTGDIGKIDADGYLWLSGRTKDVIVTSAGKNVYPEEVELRYRDLPGVAELIVMGLPTEGGTGERLCALVVPKPGASDDEIAGIRAAIDQRSAEVPSYQRVMGVEIWRGDLPKTTTMKVKRSLLRDAVLAGQRGQEAAPPPPASEGEATLSETESWVMETVARLTRTRPDLLRPADRLDDLGVDSLTRVELIGEIEARFGLRLDNRQAEGLSRVEEILDLAKG